MTPASEKAEALLARLRREQHKGGRLKVFLGAAPGVGKTYAMLQAARARLQQGTDVVAGVVETHGRRETEELLQGLPRIPPKAVEYRGRQFPEMDLDAVLQRKPELALVDELAHTNVPGLRHNKRYQDVGELLDAGIDVYTTVNIQHLESLNDTVAGITNIRVRETVPDKVLERADEILLIDLPPRELIERLREGKVYVPEQARAAIEAFFSIPNLTALRELAMRTAAAHVDTEYREFQKAIGDAPVEGETHPRLMVCIHASPDAVRMVRLGKRRADRHHIPWIVATVDTGAPLDEHRRGNLQTALLLADQLGAETARLHGSDVVHELLAFAHRKSVSDLLIGRNYLEGWRHWFGLSTAARLVRHGRAFQITIVGNGRGDKIPALPMPSGVELSLHEFFHASLIMALTTIVAWGVGYTLSAASALMVFLLGVLMAAIRSSPGPAVFSAAWAFIGYNFFFTEPRHTLMMIHYEDTITAFFFLFIALVSGNLAVRLRRQIQALRAAQQATDTLYTLSLKLMTSPDPKAILQTGAGFLQQQFGQPARVLQQDSELQLMTVIGGRDNAEPDTKDMAAADWAWKNAKPAGWSTETLSRTNWIWQPLVSEQRVLALLGVHRGEATLLPEQHQLLDALAREISLALERSYLTQDLESARIQGETEQLRSALLSSVSHDLRTPLSTLIGSVSSLLQYRGQLSDTDEKELLESTLSEAERLNRYIQNLLDMTRLGYGRMKLARDWVALEDIVGSAVQRLHSVLARLQVHTRIGNGIPLLFVHAALIEQAIVNILENAARFSPENGRIDIEARMQGTDLELTVTDQGPGIPEDERAKVFDMFYTVKKGDRAGAGTGLGLAICQGMIGAHGGRIEALAGPDGKGTTIKIVLPLENQPTLPDDAGEC